MPPDMCSIYMQLTVFWLRASAYLLSLPSFPVDLTVFVLITAGISRAGISPDFLKHLLFHNCIFLYSFLIPIISYAPDSVNGFAPFFRQKRGIYPKVYLPNKSLFRFLTLFGYDAIPTGNTSMPETPIFQGFYSENDLCHSRFQKLVLPYVFQNLRPQFIKTFPDRFPPPDQSDTDVHTVCHTVSEACRRASGSVPMRRIF